MLFADGRKPWPIILRHRAVTNRGMWWILALCAKQWCFTRASPLWRTRLGITRELVRIRAAVSVGYHENMLAHCCCVSLPSSLGFGQSDFLIHHRWKTIIYSEPLPDSHQDFEDGPLDL
jgi:hypothetical protein